MLLLEARRRQYLTATFERQAEIDRARFVDTMDMYRILDHYLATGRFSDEPANERLAS
jgi:hypothetical protein